MLDRLRRLAARRTAIEGVLFDHRPLYHTVFKNKPDIIHLDVQKLSCNVDNPFGHLFTLHDGANPVYHQLDTRSIVALSGYALDNTVGIGDGGRFGLARSWSIQAGL